MSPLEAFLLVWASAFAGACLSELFRRTYESRKHRPYGRVNDEWQPRTTRRPR